MQAVSPTAKKNLSTALAAWGLGLALYLTALKLAALPCVGGGGCGAVIQSRYGAVLGVPVGVFGAGLWIVATFVPRGRTVALHVLAAGSVGFVAVQALVLHAFCLGCTAHAVVTWTAWVWRKESPRAVMAVSMGTLLAVAGYFATRAMAEPTGDAAQGNLNTQQMSAASSALGPLSARSPVLVLSLSCPACLDKIAQLTRGSFARYRHGPALFWKTTDADRALTAAFVAAVEAQGGGREAFLGVAAVLLTQRELVTGNPAGAATWLRGKFPAAVAGVAAAEHRLARQAAVLTALGAETTPLLIAPDSAEGPRAHFAVEEIFPVE